jgi:hypothetical protein
MTRLMSRVMLTVAAACMTSVVSLAQQPTTTTETKDFEVIAVDGNLLVVRLPEGTRELKVADDFRFTVNGQPLSVHQLKPGMRGTATITTRTTVTPVTVTEVKNGTVISRSGGNITVRTDEGVKMFTQGDVDKRGVKMVRNGNPAQLSDFREGDRLTATIITSRPPRVMTEKEVQAILAAAPVATAGGASPATARPAPAARSVQAPAAQSPTPSAVPSTMAAQADTPRTLPKTATSWPLLRFVSVMFLALGCALTITRRIAG